jgi:hypothetical protein
VKLLIGEIRSDMACDAIALAAKNLQAELLIAG